VEDEGEERASLGMQHCLGAIADEDTDKSLEGACLSSEPLKQAQAILGEGAAVEEDVGVVEDEDGVGGGGVYVANGTL
jgi:hypothetical protein